MTLATPFVKVNYLTAIRMNTLHPYCSYNNEYLELIVNPAYDYVPLFGPVQIHSRDTTMHFKYGKTCGFHIRMEQTGKMDTSNSLLIKTVAFFSEQ